MVKCIIPIYNVVKGLSGSEEMPVGNFLRSAQLNYMIFRHAPLFHRNIHLTHAKCISSPDASFCRGSSYISEFVQPA